MGVGDRIRRCGGGSDGGAGGGGGLVGGPELGGAAAEDLGRGVDGGSHPSRECREGWGTRRWAGVRGIRHAGERENAGGVARVADCGGSGDSADGGGRGFLLQLSGVVRGGAWGAVGAGVLADCGRAWGAVAGAGVRGGAILGQGGAAPHGEEAGRILRRGGRAANAAARG